MEGCRDDEQGPAHSRLETLVYELADHVVSSMNIQKMTITSARCKFAFPYASPDTELRFESYYGYCHLDLLRPNQKMVALSRTSAALPRNNIKDDIKDHIALCVNSINPADRDISTLSVRLNQIYFAANHEAVSATCHASGLRHGPTHYYTKHRYLTNWSSITPDKTELTIDRVPYKWESLDGLLNLLQDSGVQMLSRVPLTSTLKLSLRRRYIYKSNWDDGRQLCTTKLQLDPCTLEATKWTIQKFCPMTYYLMHAQPSSMDVTVRACSRRQINIKSVPEGKGRIDPILTEPYLNGFLKQKNGHYHFPASALGIRSLTECSEGERIYLRYGNCVFYIDNRQEKYFKYYKKLHQLVLIDKGIREPRLVFSYQTGSLEEMVGTVTHVVHSLMERASIAEQMPTEARTCQCVDSHIPIQTTDRLATVEEAQAILRLQYEEGVLTTLLGLDSNTGEDIMREKYLWLLSLLQTSRHVALIEQLRLNINCLLAKLKLAAGENEIQH